jgi:hypothetical protein
MGTTAGKGTTGEVEFGKDELYSQKQAVFLQRTCDTGMTTAC